MAADMLVMDNSQQIAVQLTYLQDQNCWCSVDVHFKNLAVNASPSLFTIKAANRLIKDNSEQIASQFIWLQVQRSLTLHWRSFSEWGCKLVLATGPVLDPDSFIGLRGNGHTPLIIDDVLSKPPL